LTRACNLIVRLRTNTRQTLTIYNAVLNNGGTHAQAMQAVAQSNAWLLFSSIRRYKVAQLCIRSGHD